MIKKILAYFLLFIACATQAQLSVDNAQNALSLIQNTLLGSEVTLSNLTVNELTGTYAPSSLGGFECINCAVGIENGLLMSTGNAVDAIGPNNQANFSFTLGSTMVDNDMASIANDNNINSIEDLTVIEFDFVAISENLNLQVVWASEEYDTYVQSAYNDFFGAFLSGPGISGPYTNNATNLALVPGTDQHIGVRNINNGIGNAGPCQNCEYYNQFESDNYYFEHPNDPHYSNPYFIQFDGWTAPMDLQYTLVCGETYHLKLAVADATDESFDSAIFIRSRINSYDDIALVSSQFADMADSGFMFYESCGTASITFERPLSSDISEPFVIDLTIEGSASFGTDYNTLPNQVIIPAGETTYVLPIEITMDGIEEVSESLTIAMTYAGGCTNSDFQSANTFYISDAPLQVSIANQSPLVCVNNLNFISPFINGGSGNFAYLWDNGATSDTLFYTTSQDTAFSLTLTDLCTGYSVAQTYSVYVFDNEPLTLEILDPDNVLPIVCNEFGTLFVNTTGGVPPYEYSVESPSGNYNTTNITDYWVFAQNEGLNTIQVTDYCRTSDTTSIVVEAQIDEIAINLPDTIEYHCGESMTTILDVTYTPSGDSSIVYSWNMDGFILDSTNDTCQYIASGATSLSVSVNGDCMIGVADMATLVMLPMDPNNVEPFYEAPCSNYTGCSDPLACNYSEFVIFEDSSCVYDIPPALITGPITVGPDVVYNYTYNSDANGYVVWIVTNGVLIGGQGDTEAQIQWNDEGVGSITVYEAIEDCNSEEVVFNVDVVSVNETNISSIRIYPVPAKDQINLMISELMVNSNYFITDETGRQIQTGSLPTQNATIDINDLAAGHYHITLISSHGDIAHQRFLVMN
ncbi:MAG: choice-of-anchor L domain-containing protein [Flavobacteriales bacterium]|nr:choice-of-anchor L domain-containing protein [Flavobacteriales bacterium]